jgi:hypothetical protein
MGWSLNGKPWIEQAAGRVRPAVRFGFGIHNTLSEFQVPGEVVVWYSKFASLLCHVEHVRFGYLEQLQETFYQTLTS